MSSSEDETRGTKSGSYIRMKSKGRKFAEWKRKTLALANQQGFLRHLSHDVPVKTEVELETMRATYETEKDADKKRDGKNEYYREKAARKLSTAASCMMMLSVPSNLSKKIEPHMHSPFKMFKVICDKYDKKGTNKLANLCKELERSKLKNTRMEPEDWFTDEFS
jgi:hypothetical protein